MFPNRLFPARLFLDRMFPPVEAVLVPVQPQAPGVSTGGGDLTRLLARRGEEPLTGFLREVLAEVDLLVHHETEYTLGREEVADASVDWDPTVEPVFRTVHLAGVLLDLDASAVPGSRVAYAAEEAVEIEADGGFTVRPGEEEWLLENLLGLL